MGQAVNDVIIPSARQIQLRDLDNPNGSKLKVYDSALVEGDGAYEEVVSMDGSGVTVQGMVDGP